MAITKHKFAVGSQERITMFGATQHILFGDDVEHYVDEVDCSAIAVGSLLTVKLQPSMPVTLAFVAPIAKVFTAVFEVRGEDGFGEPFTEDVTISGDAGADGSTGDRWPCVQTQTPAAWIDWIKLKSYSEASATGAGTVSVGILVDEAISTVFYDNPGCAIQVQRGLTNLQVYITSENLATGILNTEPRENVLVAPESGRLTLGPLLAGPARLLSVRARPDIPF